MYRTDSPEETALFGQTLGERLRPGDVVLLTGDLGAGKSVLARGLARGAGIAQAMPSPTFTLMQPYRGRIPFYHFDLYRLNDPDEFYEAGLDEFVGGDGAAVIEWPDRADLEPDGCIRILLERGETDGARRIDLVLDESDSRAAEIRAALQKWSVVP